MVSPVLSDSVAHEPVTQNFGHPPQEPTSRWSGVAVAVSFMTISGAFLWLAQRQIPIGTAYAVWTGIGAAGTFLVGIHFYGDPTSLMRYLGVALIILGVITLKLSS
ncbi:multidrug efflux SMR transporter [Pseudomonas aeruginosa]